jgi:succinate dehydrogenase flavin-adding protein (antitoxin of CptAB toxin-antitoxin module)
MKELDVLLERYVRLRLAEASSEERQTLTRLLELPDPILSDYLFGHAAAPEPGMAALVAAIRGAPPRGATPVGTGMGPGRANVIAGRADVRAGRAHVRESR